MMRKLIIFLTLFLCSCHPITKSSQTAQEAHRADSTVYMPYLSIKTTKPVIAPCSGSVIEQQLAFLFISDPGQHRKHATCDPRLYAAAQHRAEDMALDGYFNHTDLMGLQPNYWARQFGCALPPEYEQNANNIESIGLNYSSVGLAWDAWKLSPAHRVHVLGEIDFWAEQNSYGIAVAESAWGRVFVLMTAPGCTNERVKDDK